ncbi:MAG: 1-acyl-sn-glycerol-3-phosphate acyltransferase [Gammaproteobacteria bacterium]|nr:1-acyl-sn-glycerol-3-phosphate acyltransferase [Gammaproteobacteria bacterium]
MLVHLRHAVETVILYASLTLLGLICLSWTVLALPLLVVLPPRAGRWAGRLGILAGFRFYVWSLQALGAYRLDLRALQALRHGPPVVLAPNHPSLIDALLIIAHEPRVACVMKSALMNNLFLGPGARLARYIRSDPPRRMIHEAVEELRRGGIVLLFPEGTRTTGLPINALQAGVGIIARRANVCVQTLIIETDSAFLSKGWPLFRRPSFPVRYRVRLGRCFEPGADVRELIAQLDLYFRAELADAAQSSWLAGGHSRR